MKLRPHARLESASSSGWVMRLMRVSYEGVHRP